MKIYNSKLKYTTITSQLEFSNSSIEIVSLPFDQINSFYIMFLTWITFSVVPYFKSEIIFILNRAYLSVNGENLRYVPNDITTHNMFDTFLTQPYSSSLHSDLSVDLLAVDLLFFLHFLSMLICVFVVFFVIPLSFWCACSWWYSFLAGTCFMLLWNTIYHWFIETV